MDNQTHRTVPRISSLQEMLAYQEELKLRIAFIDKMLSNVKEEPIELSYHVVQNIWDLFDFKNETNLNRNTNEKK